MKSISLKFKSTLFFRTTIQVVGLLVTLLLTYFTLVDYGYWSGQAGPGFEYIGTYITSSKYTWYEDLFFDISPGIYFSAFLSLFFLGNCTLKIGIKKFLFLVLFYIVVDYISQITLGLLSPIIGAFTPYIVLSILKRQFQIKTYWFTITGAISGVLGLWLSFCFNDPTNTKEYGITKLLFVLPWQVSIGTLLILFCKPDK